MFATYSLALMLSLAVDAPPLDADTPTTSSATARRTKKSGDTSRRGVLPLRRLRLYPTGVGYFEREGPARGGTSLPLPLGHVDDALATLVVLSGDGGQVRVTGVDFGTSLAPDSARALAGLPLAADSAVSLDDGGVAESVAGSDLGFEATLRSLVGLDVRVRVAAGRGGAERIEGRLLELESIERPTVTIATASRDPATALSPVTFETATPGPRTTLTLLTEAGELRRVDIDQLIGIAPKERSVADRLSLAAEALSDRSARTPHPLAIRVEGGGSLRVGYLAETPVWRASYRLVLDDSNTKRRKGQRSASAGRRAAKPTRAVLATTEEHRLGDESLVDESLASEGFADEGFADETFADEGFADESMDGTLDAAAGAAAPVASAAAAKEVQHARLQGWALVHNDTDEDWRNVAVELVNGEPQAYVIPLAAPRYALRELLAPHNPLSSVPQLSIWTADRLWGDHTSALLSGEGSISGGYGVGYGGGSGSFGVGGLGLSGTGRGGGGSGAGAMIEALAEAGSSDVEETAAQFLHRVTRPIDLDAHRSALVPFLDGEVAAKSVTYVNVDGEAFTAVHVVNDGAQALPEGPIAVFADEGFAGQAVLPRMRAGELRVLPIGRDLDMVVTTRRALKAQALVSVRYDERADALLWTSRTTHDVEVSTHNRSRVDRDLRIAFTMPANAVTSDSVEVEVDVETGESLLVMASPGATASVRRFTLEADTHGRLTLPTLTTAALDELLQHAAEPLRERMEPLRAVLAAISADETALATVTAAIDAAEHASARISARIATLGDGAAHVQAARRAGKELEDVEAERAKLEVRRRALEAAIAQGRVAALTAAKALPPR